MKRDNFKEIISGTKHFPICLCGKRMDWLVIYRNGKKPLEIPVCPKCNKPELMRVSPDGKITKLTLEAKGAFALGITNG